MRYTTKSGKRAQAGSDNGWRGLPAALRVCVRCGRPVTLNDSSQEHTEVVGGAVAAFWVRHWRCPS